LNKRFVGLGVPTLDHVYAIAEAPRFAEATHMQPVGVFGGGPVATALVATVRLGHRANLIACVGDDQPGREILAGLNDDGVLVTSVAVREKGRSATSVILVGPDAERTILYDPGDGIDAELDATALALIRDADGLLLESSSVASIAAANVARHAGVPVLLDADSNDDDRTLELVRRSDIVIASRYYAEATGNSPEQTVRQLLASGCQVAVVTLGAHGAVGATAEELCREPAYPVQAIDTTGAGDVYHGAFMVAHAEGRNLSEAMRFAAVVAALKCRLPGGRAGIPRRDEVRRALVPVKSR
jgi:sulfofructose kinase